MRRDSRGTETCAVNLAYGGEEQDAESVVDEEECDSRSSRYSTEQCIPMYFSLAARCIADVFSL